MQFSRQILFFIFAISLGAQAQTFAPLTRDFRVDADPTASSGAYSPAIAVNHQNKVFIAWADEIRPQRTKVYGRIYNAQGEAQTNEFRIDQSTDEVSSASGRIDIATDSAGNFYVVWEDSRKLRDYQVFGRVFTPNGKALTSEFIVDEDTLTTDTAREPAIAISNKDILALSWVKNNANVVAKFYRISAPGELAPVQPAVQIDQNSRKEPLGKDPRIACTEDGEFLITWVDNRYEYAVNQGTPLVYARQFTPEGKILANDFIVNADLPKQLISCSAPNVIIDRQKNLYFCWNDGRVAAQLNSNMTYARVFSWDRQSISGDVPIGRCISSDRPGITISPDGSIQILYSQITDTMTDPGQTFSHIFLQNVDSNLSLTDAPVQIDQGGTVDVETRFDAGMNEPGWAFTTWTQNIIIDSVNFEQQGHVYFNVFGRGSIPAPHNLRAVEVGIDQVQWNWEWFDSSEYQMNFYFKNEANQIISPALQAGTQSWLEEGLFPNQQLTRNVYATRLSLESLPSNTVTIFTRCMPPTNLTTTLVTESSVHLSWSGVATRFAVDRAANAEDEPGQWIQIITWQDSLTVPEITDTLLTPSTTYWYRVSSYNGNGLLSSATNSLQVTTFEKLPLPPVQFFGRSDSDSSILWSWQDQADDEIGFRLEDESGKLVGEPLPANTTQFLEISLFGNHTYQRRVRAVAVNGKVSTPSNYDTVTTLASSPTRFSVMDSGATTLKLTWNPGNATAFRLQRAASQNGEPGKWQTLQDWLDQFSLVQFTDDELAPGSTYWYQIHTFNKQGRLNPVGKQLQAKTLSLSGPSNFRGIALSPNEIQWSWRDNSENETGYQLLTASGEFASSLLEPNSTSWTESDLSANQKFVRRVQVLLPNQSVNKSNLDSVYTLALPPENLAVADSTSTSATLVWTGNGASRFSIERKLFDPTQSLLWEIIRDWTHQITESRFEDTGLMPQTQYLYRVGGYNGDQMQTATSKIVLVTTLASIIEPPTNLYGQAVSNTQINWFWTDNSTQEIAFRVKDENNQKITTDLPTNRTSWSESGLETNTRYSRQIFAINPNFAESGGSNLETRCTLARIPTNLTVTRQQKGVRLQWNGHGGSRFTVERAFDIDENPGAWKSIALNLTDSVYTDIEISKDTGYWYHILAYNGDSIRTLPGEPVFLAIAPFVRGDLDSTVGLGLGDLARLIQIVLGQVKPETEREMYAANYYNFDEIVNIHDIIALVDTLLRLPTLFKPDQPLQTQFAPVKVNRLPSETGTIRLGLSLAGCPEFSVLAFEFAISNAAALSIEITAGGTSFSNGVA